MTGQEQSQRPRLILVVDDDRIIVEILKQSLSMAGYQVASAGDGEQGLALARRLRPDLILLDVMMPKLDGYSVCKMLKEDPATQLVPIIILTALTDRDDKLRALEAGADEFIRKPPDRQEMLLRIKSLLRAKQLYDQVHGAASPVSTAGDSDAMGAALALAEDLRGPLSSMISSLQLLRQDREPLSRRAQAGLVSSSLLLGRQVLVTLEATRDLHKLESGRTKADPLPVAIPRVLAQAVREVSPLVPPEHVQIDLRAESPKYPVIVDQPLISRVLHYLLFNAVKFSPVGGRIAVWTQVTPKWVVVNVADQGPAVPEGARNSLFEVEHRSEPGTRGSGVGLGLVFCKQAVRAMQGNIRVTDMPGAGAVFQFWFPLLGPAVAMRTASAAARVR